MNEILLAVAALVPAIILAVYIYKKDSAEKEPPKLLALLLFSGVIIAFPVVWVEQGLGDLIYNFFLSMAQEQNGEYALSEWMYHVYIWVDNTIGVGFVEEGFKWLALYVITSKNENFNSLFDGIIYAVFVSIGFAAFENILYCIDYGWGTAIARMVTAVPGHVFFGIIMGYFYTSWHMLENAREEEIKYISDGVIEYKHMLFSGKSQLRLSVFVPTLIHGYYDYCCSIDEIWATIFFCVLLAGLYIFCFAKVRKMSMMDGLDKQIVNMMLLQKYPELKSQFVKSSSEDMWAEFREEKRKEEEARKKEMEMQA